MLLAPTRVSGAHDGAHRDVYKLSWCMVVLAPITDTLGPRDARAVRVDVNTTDATTGATALLRVCIIVKSLKTRARPAQVLKIRTAEFRTFANTTWKPSCSANTALSGGSMFPVRRWWASRRRPEGRGRRIARTAKHAPLRSKIGEKNLLWQKPSETWVWSWDLLRNILLSQLISTLISLLFMLLRLAPTVP